ncbi:MlaD family protein [Ideonella sp.]|uniref:MlaD family protein n=1 Tax=Ideonella sp. TaxID=1929293 RepID=UPI002B4858C3|nr:MlaD family protein [Ideonella sp.]HJV71622.1 MlaD family protein [Ideonella sp.]
MEPEAKYTIVGTAVIVLLALLAGAVVWLRSTGQGNDAHLYTIYFVRQSLEGLEPRSDVTMRGMRVGSVTGFRFSSRQPGAIQVFISVEPTTPVLESTRATVERHLITGIASVRLTNTTEQSPPLVNVPPGEQHAVIAEGESALQQVSATLTQLAQSADVTMQRLNATLSPENQAAFADILNNLRRVSQHAEQTLSKTDAALGSVGGAANDLRTLANSVAADARTLTMRYEALGAQAAASVKDAGDAVQKMGADVERLTKRADTLLAAGDDELRSSAQSLRSAADAVGVAAGRLREPRQILFGPAAAELGPGEGQR